MYSWLHYIQGLSVAKKPQKTTLKAVSSKASKFTTLKQYSIMPALVSAFEDDEAFNSFLTADLSQPSSNEPHSIVIVPAITTMIQSTEDRHQVEHMDSSKWTALLPVSEIRIEDRSRCCEDLKGGFLEVVWESAFITILDLRRMSKLWSIEISILPVVRSVQRIREYSARIGIIVALHDCLKIGDIEDQQERLALPTSWDHQTQSSVFSQFDIQALVQAMTAALDEWGLH